MFFRTLDGAIIGSYFGGGAHKEFQAATVTARARGNSTRTLRTCLGKLRNSAPKSARPHTRIGIGASAPAPRRETEKKT